MSAVPLTLLGSTWDHDRGYLPLAATARAWARLAGGQVRIVWQRRTLQEFADYPLDRLARDFDLVVMDHPAVGLAAATRALVPLEDLVPAELLADLSTHTGPSYESYVYGGHLWALPVDAAVQVSAYRPDLMSRLPASWDEVLDLARERHEGPRVAMPLIPVDALCSFLSLAANRGDAPMAGEGLWDHDVGVKALAWLRALVPHLHPCSLAADPPGVLELMARTDEIAYVPLIFGYANYARSHYRPHRIAFAAIPSHERGPVGALLGGAGLAISRRCADLEAAAGYAAWVASPAVQRGLYASAGGQPAHLHAWLDPAVNALTDGFFAATLATLESSFTRPRHPGFLAFQDTAGRALHDFLVRGGDPDALVRNLEAMYAASGPDR